MIAPFVLLNAKTASFAWAFLNNKLASIMSSTLRDIPCSTSEQLARSPPPASADRVLSDHWFGN
jgi:hypothetical protein